MFNVPTFFMLSRRNILSKHVVLTVLCIAGLRLSGIDMMPPPPSARPFSEINQKEQELYQMAVLQTCMMSRRIVTTRCDAFLVLVEITCSFCFPCTVDVLAPSLC